MEYLRLRNVTNVKGFPWRSGADLDPMLNALRSGAIDALLLEEPVLTRVDRASCDLILAGTTDLGGRFPPFT